MSGGRIGQPVNQVRLTNVAIVKYKGKGKIKFEIACYKNKVMNWQNSIETDLNEVLQTYSVFSNVSKGILAKKKDLIKCFNTFDEEEICRIILEKGDVQVSEKERNAAISDMYRDVVTIVVEKCVNPNSNRPYPFGVIERTMKDIHFAPILNKNAKQQALEVIPELKKHIPIERAKMKIQINMPAVKDKQQFLQKLKNGFPIVLAEGVCNSSEMQWSGLIDPGMFRPLHQYIQQESKGKGSLHVLELTVQQEGQGVFSLDDDFNKDNKQKDTEQVVLEKPSKVVDSKPKGLSCSTCGGDFGTDNQKYRQHFKTSWHRYNLKLKARGIPPVPEDEFEKLEMEDLTTFFDQLE